MDLVTKVCTGGCGVSVEEHRVCIEVTLKQRGWRYFDSAPGFTLGWRCENCSELVRRCFVCQVVQLIPLGEWLPAGWERKGENNFNCAKCVAISKWTYCFGRCGKHLDYSETEAIKGAGWEWVGESAHGQGGWHCLDCNPNSANTLTRQRNRRGELAILFLKARLLKDSLGSATSIREIGNVAKQVGVSTEEAKTFAEWLVRSIIDEAFPKEDSGFKGGVSNQDT